MKSSTGLHVMTKQVFQIKNAEALSNVQKNQILFLLELLSNVAKQEACWQLCLYGYCNTLGHIHCKKSDFRFVKSTVAKLKVKECNVLFSVILFCIIFAKEIIFVLSSIMVLVCNITFLKSNMTFVKSMIHIIEWMCYELLYTHVVVLVKIGRVLFSYYMYFLHYWLFAGLGIFAL